MAKRRVKKAVDTPRGPATSMVPVSPYQMAVRVNYGQSRGIVRGDGADWFGPLNPMSPSAPPEVAGRALDFQTGYNLVSTPRSYETINFPTMRALADSYDLLRLVIETRKDQLTKLKWKIALRKDDADEDAEPDDEQKAAIDEITKFFKRPDGVNRWRPWLRSILEDLFVIDAPSIYLQRNRGGKVIALKPIDGGTIKVIIDDWGRTPMPYVLGGVTIFPPAYQQVLKGFPAVNYTVRDVLYRPYNKRVHKVYGYSPVEQIIMTVNIAMRRQAFTLAYYTEGNIPESLIGTPDTWTPEQISAFQKMWDQMFTGNLAARRHAKFVPGGVAKTYIPTKEPDLKNPMDDWLARIVCFAFSVSPQQLVAMMNRATAETAGDQSKEEGVEAVKGWVVELIDDVIEAEFERDDLGFTFDEEVEVDQEKQQKIITGYVDDGLISINKGREMMGEEADANPAANLLMVKTATGFVPIDAGTLDGKKAAIDAGITADPTAIAESFGGGGAFGGGGSKVPPGKKDAAGDDPPAKPGASKPAAEKHAAHALPTPAFSKAARRARRLPPVPFDRAKARTAVANIKATVYAALQKVAKVAAKTIREEFAAVAKAAGDGPTKAEIDALWRSLIVNARYAGDGSSVTLADGSKLEVRRIGSDSSGDGYTSRLQFRYTAPDAEKAGIVSGDRARSIIEEAGLPTQKEMAPIKEEAAQLVANRVDLTVLETMVPEVAEDLATLAKDSSKLALLQIGPDTTAGLVDVVNERAVEMARQMGAELVGMRYDANGDLVPAARAEYRIDESTRDMIRNYIADGLEDNIGTDAIADGIEDSTGFSRDRAELIANTEVRRANSKAALDGYQEARDNGVEVKKEWLLGENPCDICQENADEGPIDLDDDFPSGDSETPAHPNCECAISPVVVEDSTSSETADAEE